MKNLITLAFLMTTAVLINGCGALNDSCGSDIRMGCNAIFGELPDDAVSNELQDIKDDIQEIDNEVQDLKQQFSFYKADTQQTLDTFEISLGTLENSIASNSYNLSQLKTNFLDALVTINYRLGNLEDDLQIVSITPPCQNSTEVIFEFSDGTHVGYFENNDNRYLSVLAAGSYVTTDGTGCRFTID